MRCLGEGSEKVFTLQLIAAKRLRSLILVKRNIDDPTRPDCPLLNPEIADLRDHWVLRAGALGGSSPLADQLNGVAVNEAGSVVNGRGFESRYDQMEDSLCTRVMDEAYQEYGLFFAGHFGAKLASRPARTPFS